MKVGIIGAGPAGMTAAYQLSKAGVEVHVFEIQSTVGGMSKTIELWNQKVDIGPHRFFSKDKQINELWKEVAGEDYRIVNRLTRIFYNQGFYYYPLRLMNALRNLGLKEAFRCVASYIQQKLFPSALEDHFEYWVKSRFGARLYEIFFKNYSEKLWGIPCTSLDADFAAQRIKKLSLFSALYHALFRNNNHQSLLDQFAYPTGGTGMIYENMKKFIQDKGNFIHLNEAVRKLHFDGDKVVGLSTSTSEKITFDHVISTMPLTILVNNLPNVPQEVKIAANALTFRNTILVYLKVNGDDLFPDNWIYIHSPELRMGRVTNFRNWVPELYGKEPGSILAIEFWCDPDDSFWKKTNTDLIQLAKDEINQTALIGDHTISEAFVYRIPKCYPVYKTGYKKQLQKITSYLSCIQNLHAIGRYGAFKYNNQDHSILMGILVAENILSKKQKHNLWDINTDYGEYQEE